MKETKKKKKTKKKQKFFLHNIRVNMYKYILFYYTV